MRWTGRRVCELVETLEALYGKPRFISRFDPVDELVSCILSQHTTDASSFPTFSRLREAYPNWADVAALTPSALAGVIRKAGLPNQKANAIIGSLKEIYARTGSYSLESLRRMKLQEAREWLLSLPGVGPKTAAIVLCFGFGMPAIPVDTHVFRVSWRLGLVAKVGGEAKAHGALEALVPPELAFRFHTAFIQHGRHVCRAPTPQCERCPLTRRCDWFSKLHDIG